MKILKYMIVLVFFSFLGIAGFAGGCYLWISDMAQPVSKGAETELYISPGSNQRQIAAELKQKNIIRSAFLFRIYTRFLAVDQRLRPGTYSFAGTENLNEVVFMLLKGSMQTVQVTIPEGLTIKAAASILEENGICKSDEFIAAVSNPELLARVFPDWKNISSPEGLVFPDTYSFFRPTEAKKAAERMLRLTKHQTDKILQEPLPAGLSPYEACILASIVEEEAALPQERRLIASVFYNRLERRMKLESCATVLYALGEHKNRILFEDLKTDSPYNTYLYPGLPPTPIANFGTSALRAVADPEKTDYLFFVSDNNRGHRFAKSLGEHNQNRHQFYERRRKERKKR